MQIFKKTLGFALLLLSTAVLAQQQLPDAQLKDLDGKIVQLKDFIKPGEYTFVSFWATWCSPCKKELDNLADLYPEWQEKYRFNILAISVDDARTAPRVKGTVKGRQWPYVFLLDSNQDMQRLLNFQAVPQSFLVGPKGEILYGHASYKEGDEYTLEAKLQAYLAAEQKQD